jgi:hypothetical protein
MGDVSHFWGVFCLPRTSRSTYVPCGLAPRVLKCVLVAPPRTCVAHLDRLPFQNDYYAQRADEKNGGGGDDDEEDVVVDQLAVDVVVHG